ncbi:MAG: FkbM family methyltransferase [Rubrimonas sp.]
MGRKKLLRNLRHWYLKTRRPRRHRLHGVWLPTDPDYLPDDLIKAIYKGVYENEEAALARRRLARGDRVLELGGGVGLMGTIAAQACGSDNVITYEANPALERVIRRTHALNGVAPTLRMRAIAPRAGAVTFHVNDNIVSSSLLDRNFGGARTVEADALADVLATFRPNVVICDIEGAETAVFEDVDLSAVDRILIELHPKIVGAEPIAALLRRFETQGLVVTEGQPDKACYLERADRSG